MVIALDGRTLDYTIRAEESAQEAGQRSTHQARMLETFATYAVNAFEEGDEAMLKTAMRLLKTELAAIAVVDAQAVLNGGQ